MACFCLAWTTLSLDCPLLPSRDLSGKLLKSLRGRDAGRPLLLERAGALRSAGCAEAGVGDGVSFPEMWQPGEKANGIVAL